MIKRGIHIVFIAILLTGSFSLNAQVSFNNSYYPQWWIGMNNYNTKTESRGIRLVIDSQSQGSAVNIPNWRISARVVAQTPASNGKYFPIDKVSLQPNSTLGTVAPVPSAGQIGLYPNIILSTAEQDLVSSSMVPIAHNAGQSYRLELLYDWTIQGGAYLSDLQQWQNYYFSVEYKLFSGNGQLLGSVIKEHYVQIGSLSGIPPVENNFSLTVNGGARNGTLTLQSRSDYDSGTSVTYTNGLTVNTNSAYQVTVNASPGTPYFSYGNNNIDLDVLNVQLATTASGVTYLNQVTLSTGAQVLAKGGSTANQNINFDVGYSINLANKDKLLYAFKEKQAETTYSTTLQYTILAQ
ncbi:MAG: hypothetical protein LRY55_08660 [Leadbetterella sp.]|nr:hypothetical protein [Leadbetterella sp.]